MVDADSQRKVDAFFRKYVTWRLARPSDFTPCTEDDLRAIGLDQGVRLPGVYRAFMARTGRGGPFLPTATRFYFPRILGLRRYVTEELDSWNVRYRLPGDALVFCILEDEYFSFVPTTMGEDPPVYRWEGDDLTPLPANWPSLSAFLNEIFLESRSEKWLV